MNEDDTFRLLKRTPFSIVDEGWSSYWVMRLRQIRAQKVMQHDGPTIWKEYLAEHGWTYEEFEQYWHELGTQHG